MRKGKRAALVGMAFVMALLGGCGKKNGDGQASANSEAKEHVYRAENINLPDLDNDTINSIFYKEDKIVVVGTVWEETDTPFEETEDGPEANTASLLNKEVLRDEEAETGEEDADGDEAKLQDAEDGEADTQDEASDTEGVAVNEASDMAVAIDGEIGVEEPVYSSIQKQYTAVYDYDGNRLSYTEAVVNDNEWYGSWTAAETEDALYCVVENYFEDYSDPDNYIWEQNYFLAKKNYEGEELWRVSLKDYQGEDYFYVSSLLCDKEGRIILFTPQSILIFSADSDLVKQMPLEEDNGGNAYLLSDGRILVSCWGETSQYFKELDLESGQLTGEYKVPGNSYNYSYYSGYGYDLFLTDSSGLYGYNLGDENVTMLMNYVDSDLDASGLSNIKGSSDTEFYAGFYSYTDNQYCYAKFRKVDPKDVKDKKVITLGCIYVDYDVRRQVVNFNKTNEEYRIQIRDYSTYNTEEDYTQSYTRLNTDIVSGNTPDIMMLNSSLPVSSYISKGLFEDLYPFIDGDGEMNRDDFLGSVLETFSTDGKLYRLVPSFTVLTVAGKVSDVGTGNGWTLDELNALVASKGEGVEVFNDTIRETVLNRCMQLSSGQFINWDTGECTFDSDGFVKLLEFIKSFPAEYDESRYDDENYWNNYDSMYRDGRTLLSNVYLSDFRTYNRMEKGSFGEEINMIGFPADNRKGSALDSNLDFAMSSKSANKDGAWQFLRYFLTYEYQDPQNIYGFPVNAKRFEELKKTSMEKPYYLDENDKKVEYDETYWIGEVEVKIPPMTEAEVQKVEDFIFSVDQVVNYDEDLIHIIQEEAEGFFSGQKSAREVAGVIQSRVKIYVNENR